jgi:hypothetical protein
MASPLLDGPSQLNGREHMSELKTIECTDLTLVSGGQQGGSWINRDNWAAGGNVAGKVGGAVAGGAGATYATGGNVHAGRAGAAAGGWAGGKIGSAVGGAIYDAGSWMGTKAGNWWYGNR